MGLKTKNYEVKKLGITIPEAYAVANLSIDGNSCYVTVKIQTSRENAKKLEPIETIHTHFVIDRNKNPFEEVYNKLKGQEIIERENPVTGEKETITVNGILYGWEDDYLTVE